MTIAFLPWPTSIYSRSKSACELQDDNAIHGPLPSYSALCMVFDVMAAKQNGRCQSPLPSARLPIVIKLPMRRRPTCGDVSIAFAVVGGTGIGGGSDVGGSGANSHLAGRDELQRPEGGLEVGGVGLEVVEGAGNALLELRGVLAAGAVGRDLVEGRGAHGGGCRGYRVADLRGGSGESEGRAAAGKKRLS